MSDGQKNRQFRQDLVSILRPSKSLYNSNRIALIGDASLHSMPSATAYKSLCQRDTIALFYAPVDSSGRNEDWRSRPYKVESERSYRFVASPSDELRSPEMEGAEFSPFDRECRDADEELDGNEWAGWFTAKDQEAAMAGGFAMQALGQWLAVPENQFANCIGKPDPARCKQGVTHSVSLDSIDGVGECQAESNDQDCIVLGKWGVLFKIRARKSTRPMRQVDIISVSFEEQIIVT